jgi:hypothetical protein
VKHTSRLFIAAILAVSLAGCAGSLTTIENAYSTLTTASVSPQAVVLAASAYDVVEVSATNYLRARRCTGTNGPVCRDPAVTPTIIATMRSGRVARDKLKQFLRDHPGQLGPKGDYDALIAATDTLRSLTATYQAAAK